MHSNSGVFDGTKRIYAADQLLRWIGLGFNIMPPSAECILLVYLKYQFIFWVK
jgi:hypothetical protein